MGAAVSVAKRVFCSRGPTADREPQKLQGPVFGAPLESVVSGYGDGAVPDVVRYLCDMVFQEARLEEGVFRVPAEAYLVQDCVHRFNKGEKVDLGKYRDPHLYSALLKRFFAVLPTPSIPPEFLARLTTPGLTPTLAREVLTSLPKPALHTTAVLLRLLHALARYSGSNRMTSHNLAVCWAPCLFRIQIDSLESVNDLRNAISALTLLIDHAPLLCAGIEESAKFDDGSSSDTASPATADAPAPAPALASSPRGGGVPRSPARSPVPLAEPAV